MRLNSACPKQNTIGQFLELGTATGACAKPSHTYPQCMEMMNHTDQVGCGEQAWGGGNKKRKKKGRKIKGSQLIPNSSTSGLLVDTVHMRTRGLVSVTHSKSKGTEPHKRNNWRCLWVGFCKASQLFLQHASTGHLLITSTSALAEDSVWWSIVPEAGARRRGTGTRLSPTAANNANPKGLPLSALVHKF